ncbi:MAG: 16S rRNA (uracil(1498)-N(3))-methyltransferase [Planctomycetota bacterium]|jgi:16S rRNA (uracil1498-N3)-methyltransferase|nr:16S rRNA (uracil(1498)-N(3))-methyltransferase [Planctomycetota bacterium]
MSRLPRFFVDEKLEAGKECRLSPGESHHAVEVLRLGENGGIVVFDGRGGRSEAMIVKADRRETRIRLGIPESEPGPAPRLGLAVAIPKGRRWQNLVEKCTELGVDRIIPLLAERSVSRGEGDASRWRRWSLEAAKQCLRCALPEISGPVELPKLLEREKKREEALFLADREGKNPSFFGDRLANAGEILFLIGPEGGFTPAEAEACRNAGAVGMRLSPHVLRIETAAAAAAITGRAFTPDAGG